MPYWRLSSFYFFYFAVLGLLAPYWGLYLKSLGFDAVDIGTLMAIPMATKIIAPNIWGWLGDHYGHRMRIVRIASFASMMIFTMIFVVNGFWMMASAMILFSFFWNAALPQFEVITLAYLGEKVRQYSRVRVWGSIGFIIAVILLGILIDKIGITVVPISIFLVYLAIWLSSLMVPETKVNEESDGDNSFLQKLKQPAIIVFLLAAMLMQFSHGAYYAFYSIYMESYGYSKTLIGQFWALGVLAEVLVFIYMHHMLQKIGAGMVIVISLFLASLRWLMIGWFPESLMILLIAQVLHAASFGTFHAAAIHMVHRAFKGRHQGRGQAIYASVSFGIGGSIGSLVAGNLWEKVGPQWTFTLSAAVAGIAAIIAFKWHDKQFD
jgi:PPP family 3-phenylpropionic acid transporter